MIFQVIIYNYYDDYKDISISSQDIKYFKYKKNINQYIKKNLLDYIEFNILDTMDDKYITQFEKDKKKMTIKKLINKYCKGQFINYTFDYEINEMEKIKYEDEDEAVNK